MKKLGLGDEGACTSKAMSSFEEGGAMIVKERN